MGCNEHCTLFRDIFKHATSPRCDVSVAVGVNQKWKHKKTLRDLTNELKELLNDV